MSNKICQRCGRELTQVQRWNRKKYCSHDCFCDAHFGERIEWNGVWLRPGKTLEFLKLCQKGLTEAEALRVSEMDRKELYRIRGTPELAAFLPERNCLFCGRLLPKHSLLYKYCSKSCSRKAKYDHQNAVKGRTTHRVDHIKRNRAIELFARGLDSGSIARYLDTSAQEVKGWIYTHSVKRADELCPELVPLLPLRDRLKRAQSAEEWRNILHNVAGSFGMPGLVVLVTEALHGGGSPGRYTTIVLEKLRQNPVGGVKFAFCNLLKNAVTTIEWRDENVHLTRTLKMSGTFVWPDEHLGDFVTVTKEAFSHLLSYQKYAKRSNYFLEKT